MEAHKNYYIWRDDMYKRVGNKGRLGVLLQTMSHNFTAQWIRAKYRIDYKEIIKNTGRRS